MSIHISVAYLISLLTEITHVSPMLLLCQVTGLEEPMYHAKVMVTSKVRKHDLPVNCGDTVSIIRTTNCPKGKWLARDATHRCACYSGIHL